MSLALKSLTSITRKSQRKRNKIAAANSEDFKIPNPYKQSKSHQSIPSELGKQLSKYDFLSMKNL
jgi:hypothetical protein